MRTFFFKIRLLLLLATGFSFLGCVSGSQYRFNPEPTISPTVQAISTQIETLTLDVSITPIVNSTVNPSENDWDTTKVPIEKFIGDSQEEIAEKLIEHWLSYYESENVDKHIRLLDYRVHKVVLQKEYVECAKNLGVSSIATIDFSIQTLDYPVSEWFTPNGTPGDNQWINDKSWIIAVYITGSDYAFKVLGAPPCIGIAVDGSTVP